MDRYQQNDTIRLEVWALNSSNAGVTGATVTLTIRRAADGYYWDGAAFGATLNTVTMTETDSTNFAGLYHYNFATSGLADATYTAKATTATATVVNDPYIISFVVGGYVDNIDAAVSSRSSHSAADVWAAGTRTLTASLDPTAAQIADQVWDETASDHLTSGTFGFFFKRIRAYIANKVAIASNAYTVYDDDGSSTYATGTTTASDGTRTP